ncbi:Gfo/Idh/MocA family protein [Aureibacillus halotolerans]|uniref:Putative dehydrogenase n=1 Tax=Aureibacillus halotolerans TaxID=1508390 RepID=A0A4R6TT44_9BACI|nr:Gfo/Idh/MocA family oxidoreductase [Aureibacillus halotolerans]TDQ33761.1 putative dehydrogenase [Aureibacillus halotolerans]
MKQYKIGIVGAGGVTGLHFDGYKPYPERIKITALCDPNEALLHEKADKHGISARFTNLDDFLRKGDVDVVVVCTPSPIRKQVLFPIIEAGFPVFVEKPFSDSLQEAREITEKAKSFQVPISVNQNFRRHFPFELVGEKVKEGVIGKITTIVFTNLMYRQDVGWRTECERHALSVMGIHWFDGFRQVIGEEAEDVYCLMSSSNNVTCAGETDATVQVRFKNGTTVTYIQSFSSGVNKTEMTVIGEKGTLQVKGSDVERRNHEQNEPMSTWSHPVSREQATYEGLNQLLTAIDEGTIAANSAEDNLNTIALLDAAYVSAKERRIVSL